MTAPRDCPHANLLSCVAVCLDCGATHDGDTWGTRGEVFPTPSLVEAARAFMREAEKLVLAIEAAEPHETVDDDAYTVAWRALAAALPQEGKGR
jgi:hypothetical protein